MHDEDQLALQRPPHCSLCIPEELHRWVKESGRQEEREGTEDSLLRATYFRSSELTLPPSTALHPDALSQSFGLNVDMKAESSAVREREKPGASSAPALETHCEGLV